MSTVSVIVPAYNEARFLPRSLGSLYHSALTLPARCPQWTAELIVVDNGSSDDTAAVAEGFGARVVAEPHRGVARARNAGAAAAGGNLLVFVDADYRVPHSLLPVLVDRFTTDVRLGAAGVRVCLEPSEIDPVTRFCSASALGALRRFQRMSFGVFAFRRGYFVQLDGFDEAMYAYEDVELLRRVGREPGRYRVIGDLTVYASARGFYRGGMLRTYARMALSRRARRDFDKCGYWYGR
jgi:glycosyltransferase involved in cell wall biosynthesis